MLIIAFLFAALSLTFSAPVLPPTTHFSATPSTPLVVIDHKFQDCAGVTHHRTIQNIVWSCLTTIFACAWVAVHPNVSRPGDSGWLRLKQRVIIMIYAILTPEFIIIWALRQRMGAAVHMREYNEKFHPSVVPPSRSAWWYIKRWFRGADVETPEKLWTITHGFLLEMLGMINDRGEVVGSVDSIPNTLDILEDDISDKSKGDFLTKFLVLLQTTYFIFQCIIRWITHLPVTELEVVTFAFALLNIGTYALWWHKPQNVAVAIRMDRYKQLKDTRDENGKDVTTRTSQDGRGEMPLEVGLGTSLGDEQTSVLGGESSQNADEDHSVLPSESSLRNRPCRRFTFLAKATAAGKQCIHGLGALVTAVVVIFDPRRLRFLEFEDVIAFTLGPIIPILAMSIESTANGTYDRIFYSSKRALWEASICFIVTGILFGGLHLIPLWSSPFPSTSERLLWKLSAGFLTVGPLMTAALPLIVALAPWEFLEVLIALFDIGFFGSYLITRVILIVLAFTTLRDLPPDAFRGVAWTTIIPHL